MAIHLDDDDIETIWRGPRFQVSPDDSDSGDAGSDDAGTAPDDAGADDAGTAPDDAGADDAGTAPDDAGADDS
jgi:hypothetical protein